MSSELQLYRSVKVIIFGVWYHGKKSLARKLLQRQILYPLNFNLIELHEQTVTSWSQSEDTITGTCRKINYSWQRVEKKLLAMDWMHNQKWNTSMEDNAGGTTKYRRKGRRKGVKENNRSITGKYFLHHKAWPFPKSQLVCPYHKRVHAHPKRKHERRLLDRYVYLHQRSNSSKS